MNTTMFMLITFLLFVSPSLAIPDLEADFCVADYSLPRGPTGYSCKDPSNVTINDFVYTGLRTAGSSDNVFKTGVKPASVLQFPGLNGLEVSMARIDIEVGGVVPMHTHRVSEIVLLMSGRVIAGLIDTNNVAYYKTLKPGDIFCIPPTLLHFQVNNGATPALIFAFLGAANPGFQVVDTALFAGNLPPELVEKTVLLDRAQIKKLRNVEYGDFAPNSPM